MLEKSNVLNVSGHDIKKAWNSNYLKNQGEQGEDNYGDLDLLEIIGEQKDSIISIVLWKFNKKAS